MDDRIKKYVSVYSTVLLALCYCYFISSRIQKGFFRLICLLPIFYIFAVVPLYLPPPSILLASILTIFITWLANFKLLLFAFGQGPLSSLQSSKNLHIFITTAALPVRTKPINNPPSSRSPKKIPILNHLGAEILTTAILIGFLSRYKENLHPKVLLIGYCCLTFLLVDCVVASSSFLVRALVGLELEPPSDEPYLSESLQEFWGKRWNLAITNILRLTVYKPVRSASAGILGDKLAPLPAVLAAFIVSGLMHELFVFYTTGAKPSWEHTSFFVLHGICVVVEVGINNAFKGRWRLPWFVSRPLTLGFVLLTSSWLFFPPLMKDDADTRMLQEFVSFGEFVKSGISAIVS